MSEEYGTRRCRRSSKYLRNLSLTSVDFIPAPDDLRNLVGRKTAPGQRVEHAPPPQQRSQIRASGPESFKGAPQGLAFPLGAALGLECGRDRVAREAPGLQLPLDPRPPVARPARPHGGPRRRQVVEESVFLQTREGIADGRRREAALLEGAGQFGPAPRPDRQESQRPLPRSPGGVRIG